MYRQILKQYWGYDDFRGIQREIIDSIGSGKDTLGLMPTGGGKSITFQVPAIAKEGVCIVVTPLIALMKDQVQHLRENGVSAEAVYSGMSHSEILKALENCILGHVKLLYVSPERLGSQIFITKFRHMDVSFITVDEAHCISQWGYDFRPSYLRIAEIRKLKPGTPILALTATATPDVIQDIQKKLEFNEENVFKMSFERKNVIYVVRKCEDKNSQLLHILNSVPGCSIVYTRSRKGTRDISKFLNDNGVSATFYHAGLENANKDQRQKEWRTDLTRVMVATNAFGMGIDKPDVRLVIHMDCPDSIEAYFQEAGRAGRDGKRSYAVLLYNNHDTAKLHHRIPDTYPDKEIIKQVYEHLAYFYQVAEGFGNGHSFMFDIEKFCRAYSFYPVHVESSLQILQNAGYIEYDADPQTRARLRFRLERDQLYMLHDLTPNEDKVVQMVLRMYPGLFTDYIFIDEAMIALKTGLDQNTVYQVLMVLSKRGIVHFIPQLKMPFITYMRDRVDMDKVVIPPSIYEDRRREMMKRIDSVIEYATDDSVCRSVKLLEYFGEKGAEECRRCDVCTSENNADPSAAKILSAEEAITNLLNDGSWHEITELHKLKFPTDKMNTALRHLLQEEIVIAGNEGIKLKKH